MGAASRRRPTDRVLTAVVPLWLDRADHEMAHTGCHASALLWNAAVAWVRGEWDEGRSPGREDIRRYIETLPSEMRTLHSQTVQGIAYDLWEMIRGTQTRRRSPRRIHASRGGRSGTGPCRSPPTSVGV